MAHGHKKNGHVRHSKSREWQRAHASGASSAGTAPKLDIVLKCDSSGSMEAVAAAVSGIVQTGVDINIIYSAVGDIHESDILIAETGSRLIVGFQVDAQPGVDALLREYGVEVRLHNVIYKLTADLRNIAGTLIPHVPGENITGSARVIALFKSSRRGIIIGCEVLSGFLSLHQHFRVISAMGPVYSGTIESMHIEKDAVQKAMQGQQVGIKIKDFKKARIGDLVESFRPVAAKESRAWKPGREIIRAF